MQGQSWFNSNNNSFEKCIQQAIKQVSNVISLLLSQLQQIYLRFSLNFSLQKQYAHKVFMSMVTPVELRVQYDLERTCYFRTKQAGVQNFRDKNEIRASQGQIQKIWGDYSKLDQNSQDKNQKLLKQMNQKGELDKRLKQSFNSQNNQKILSDYQSMNQWIRQQINRGKKVSMRKMIEKIKKLKSTKDQEQIKKWISDYLKKYPEINDLLFQSKSLMQTIIQQTQPKQISIHRPLGKGRMESMQVQVNQDEVYIGKQRIKYKIEGVQEDYGIQ